jgi:DNA-directed RNA polymerase subunit RPC12/RpoP
MILTCAKCGRRHPLTEEEVAFFYPRFFCLSCGERIAFPVDEERVRELKAQNDPDRRLSPEDLRALDGKDRPRKALREAGAGGGADGG